MGVRANGCDNSSAPSAVSAVELSPVIDSTSDDNNQPSASLSTETANPSSLQDDFQTSEPKVKRLKSTESTPPNSIPTFPPTQGLLSVADLTYKSDIGLWQDLTEEMRDYWCRKGSGDCLNETANIVNGIQIDGNKKKILGSSCFTVLCQMREEKDKLALILQV